ncbi:DUF1361 domain-containing protein [Prosthecobacter vanneervenii]|uniref:Putative membrane protein n=1 Tax=Prosthecobacter vanneervenii TaxID=48466 RepID=A0A7W7YC70_9BACT|nr:DUF1361 domain-containing protein [Prosthecobacter vanneervenii]MBB5033502.1 putative membrane protein [Prosthecobacter vanneervenii]
MSARVFLLNLCACLWCCFTLVLRIHLAGHHHYAFMVWNLFLAAIPLGLSLGLSRISRLSLALPVLALWLLFFPNAPYVLTDLIHLNEHPANVPKWLDLLMLLSFALVSLWLGFQSLHIVQHWFARKFSHATAWCVSVGSLGLSGFGVYLGRFDRWNSWDLLHRPASLLTRIASYVLHPLAHSRTWGFTLGFGTLLILAYLFWLSSAAAAPVNRKIE